jgi:CPA1 family monovalent cation:H+ antiporter
MVSFFDLFAILVTLTAAFGWLNKLFFHLPSNIGLLLMGLAASLIVLLVDLLVPGIQLIDDLENVLRQIDFYDTVMHGMLGFLLFAGALHVDWGRLQRRLAPVMLMATVGVVISTFVVGTGLWAMAPLLGVQLPLAWALVFGALISPTDPVAVLSMLKTVHVPRLLETEMSGESLLNDGVGVVLFTILLTVATSGDSNVSIAGAAGVFVLEAFGGALLGLVTGYVAFQAMRSIDDYVVEIFISLALVSATYALAERLHISGPIAVVAAGLLIGERGPAHAMSETTQQYLFSFWTMVDELLNSILFLLIGLELLVIGINLSYGWLAVSAIPLVLAARAIAIALPVAVLSRFMRFIKGTMPVLVWGGVRGGISIALALSLPYTDERPIILTATYAVVLFTIIVQGLTLTWVIRRTVPSSRPQAEPGSH